MKMVDKAPVLPSSNVVLKAKGSCATIPVKIISEIPLPIPLCVICFSQPNKKVPDTKVITVVNLKTSLDP